MTDFKTAVPKFGGRTFLRQMETALSRGSPLILINAWNEWIAQRFCLDSNGNHTHLCYDASGNNIGNHFPEGKPVFVDLFTREYSRDFEPDTGSSEYYQLLVNSVPKMKANKSSSEGAKLALSESEAQEYLDLNLDVKAAYLAKPKSDTRSLVEFASDHYFAFSAIEGRPRSVKEYVDCNPDVGYGFRDPKVNTNIDEAKTNIRAFVAKHFQAVVQPVPVSSRKIRTFGCMDLEKYVLCYGDVFRSCSKVINGDPYVIEAARKCVLNHYNEFGKKEGRDGIKGCTPP